MTTQFPTDAVYLRMQSYVSDKPARQHLRRSAGSRSPRPRSTPRKTGHRAPAIDEAEDMPEQASAHREVGRSRVRPRS